MMCVCVCVCVFESEREREDRRGEELLRVLILYLLSVILYPSAAEIGYQVQED